MKKIAYSVATLLIALSFTACNHSNAQPSSKCGASKCGANKPNKNGYIEGESSKKCGASQRSKCGAKTEKGFTPAG